MNNFKLVGFRKYVFFLLSFLNNIVFILYIIIFTTGDLSIVFANSVADVLSINMRVSSLISILILINYIFILILSRKNKKL